MTPNKAYNSPYMVSANEELKQYPEVRDNNWDIKGKLLYLPWSGLVVVPSKQLVSGWNCIVIVGNGHYMRGGYDIYVSSEELRRDPEIAIETNS